ncbi:hypothetical protein [Intrasporangium sp. YIM S08009]|uniref:hypothetical protein n=1 Tax=Intrasporangium zincisolvens TaxID=3080018 RepID=UPI002B0597A3|nr:hypothetical protein [Intrasporangium sp. YIM S08009]
MKANRAVRRSGLTAALVVAVMVLVAGVVYAVAAKPGITVQVSPASQSVTRGGATTYTLTLGSTNGFAGTATLTASGLPSGATASFTPATVTLAASGTGSTATASVTVTTTSTTPVGSSSPTFTATSGKTSGDVTAGLTVNYQLSGSLTMSATPAATTLAAGSSAVYSMQLSRTGMRGPVSFSVSGGLPSGATWGYTPNSTTGSTATLQVDVPATASDGTYTLYLVASGSDDAGTTRYAYASVQLTVTTSGKAFTIAGTAQTPLAPGVTAPLALALTNPNKKPVAVTNLTVTVTSVTRTPSAVAASLACSTADYQVRQYGGPYPLTVAGSSTMTLAQLGVAQSDWPALTLLDRPVNQDGCKGATVTLAYAGSGQGT